MPVSPFVDSNYNTGDLRRRQVMDVIDVMSPREISFLQLIGMNGEPGTNPKIEWMNDQLLAESTTLAEEAAQAETALDMASGTGINIQPGNLLKVDDEWMYVTGVATDTVTVVRAVGGSSDVLHTNGSTVEIVSIANLDSAARPTTVGTKEPTFDYNYFQAFDTGFDMSYISMNTAVYGQGPQREARELARAVEQVTIKLEKAAFDGPIREAETVSGTAIPPLMGGLSSYIKSGGANYYVSAASAQLTEKMIIDMLEDRYYTVGSQNMAKTLIVGSWNARRISDIYAPSARMSTEDRTGGVVVDVIRTQFGPVDVLLNLRCPKSKVYLVNTEFLKVHPYTNLDFAEYELATTGAQIKKQIYGVYSMSVRNPRAMGVIAVTATS